MWLLQTGTCWSCRTRRQMGLPGVDLGHAPDPSTPETRVLIAIPPAVDSPLDQATLLAEVRIELCQGPSDGIALALVVEAIAFVLLLAATRARIHAVGRLEVRAEFPDDDGFDVTADRVFHLDAIARVLEGDPLHTVAVLADHEGGRCRDGTGCCTRGVRR